MNHPEALDIVGTLINSPHTGWLHYRLGAAHPYLPEMKPPGSQKEDASRGAKAWRASKLPKWSGDNMTFHLSGLAEKPDDGSSVPIGSPGGPPFKGHRWLPLRDNDQNLDKTPVAKTEYYSNGADWWSWAIAAQLHYSLLENIEKDQLNLYEYGFGKDKRREGLWNMQYERMNINFMAIWGKDVIDNLPFSQGDDELELSVKLNIKLRRRTCLH